MPEVKDIVRDWIESFDTKDADRILEPLADDVAFYVETNAEPLGGKDALRGILEEALPAYDTVHVSVRETLQEGDQVAVLAEVHAKFDADIRVLGTTLPTKGKDVRTLGAMFVRVNDEGRITRVTRVRDNWSVVRQLDLPRDKVDDLFRKMQERLGAPSPPAL